jgi:hypothetical protein
MPSPGWSARYSGPEYARNGHSRRWSGRRGAGATSGVTRSPASRSHGIAAPVDDFESEYPSISREQAFAVLEEVAVRCLRRRHLGRMMGSWQSNGATGFLAFRE